MINLVQPDQDKSDDIKRTLALGLNMKKEAKVPKVDENYVWKLFEFEQGKSQLESHIVYRSEFMQKIILFANENFKKQNKQDFLTYFKDTTLHTLKSYIKKLGAGTLDFRTNQLWKPNVCSLLKTNEDNILMIAKKYRNGRAFSIDSSLALLSDAKINLERPSSKLTHMEIARRIFAQSKQTVRNERELYYYTLLEDIEIFEYISRIADNLYHLSYSLIRPKD